MFNKNFQKKKDFYSCFIFSIITGCLLHFTYNLSGDNKFVGYFSAVNESIWEHSKLSVFPILFFTAYLLVKNKLKIKNYFIALSLSMLVATVSMPILFYSYYKFTHKSYLPLDLIIFVICCYLSCKTFFYIISIEKLHILAQILGFILFILILYCFIKWTYNPPNLGLFKELSIPSCCYH